MGRPVLTLVHSTMFQVYRVYHAMRESGADLIMPPPPPAVLDNPNVRHGVIDRPDPHKVDDKARLLAQIEMDQGRTPPATDSVDIFCSF